MDIIVGRHVVELVEALQTDAVGLGDGVHRFACTDIVQTTLVVLGGLFLLLLQPDDLTLGQTVVLITLVVLGYLLVADINLLANGFEVSPRRATR